MHNLHDRVHETTEAYVPYCCDVDPNCHFLMILYNPGESAPCLGNFPKILPLDQGNCLRSVLQTVVGAVEIDWNSPLPEVKEKIKGKLWLSTSPIYNLTFLKFSNLS